MPLLKTDTICRYRQSSSMKKDGEYIKNYDYVKKLTNVDADVYMSSQLSMEL